MYLDLLQTAILLLSITTTKAYDNFCQLRAYIAKCYVQIEVKDVDCRYACRLLERSNNFIHFVAIALSFISG